MRPAASVTEGGFRSNQAKPLKAHHAGRAQRLHDIHSRGRAYDIISGARTPVAAPAKPATGAATTVQPSASELSAKVAARAAAGDPQTTHAGPRDVPPSL